MATPGLRITAAAKAALLGDMARITEYKAVASVVWCLSGSEGHLRPDGSEAIEVQGPHWGVGYYSPSKVPAASIVQIEGIPFAFVQEDAATRLAGATLDYAKDRYVVIERAI